MLRSPHTRPRLSLTVRVALPPALRAAFGLLLLLGSAGVARAQGVASGAIAGIVTIASGGAAEGARVALRAATDGRVTEVIVDGRGTFVLGALSAGRYRLEVRLLGHAQAVIPTLRLVAGDTLRVEVVLVPSATPLSTVVVVRSPTEVDALDPRSSQRITTETALLLPTARDAAAVVALVPGAKDGRLWGGAGTATNDYRVDGVPMNHPGVGGDFLRLPREWVDAVEVHGIGANAEFGDFQGGVIDARTRSGRDGTFRSVRSLHDPPALSATNLTGDEIGAEPAGRTEVGAEAGGAILPARLFYFTGARFVDRRVRAPALSTPSPTDFLATRERTRELRGFGKLSWLGVDGARLDVSLGAGTERTDHAGLDGLDDVSALPREESGSLWYHAAWRRSLGERTLLEARVAGSEARQSQRGGLGIPVPSVQVIRRGDLPRWQNPEFDLASRPSSHSAGLTLRRAAVRGGLAHAIALGIETSVTGWRETRLRNGHLTWRPYVADPSTFVALDATTWTTVGSDWGGEQRLRASSQALAAFLQDEVTIGTRLTIAPGLRLTRWGGWLVPCTSDPYVPTCAGLMRAVRAVGLDPRLGLAWDVTGRGTAAIKAHWGRYHQGMYAQLFDRSSGANVYTNERFYYTAPPLADARRSFTALERDAALGPTGFSAFYDERILDESGVVRGYRQPYVDQASLTLERRFGTRWKVALLALHRRNGDIVGLVDRNLASNYTRLADIRVDHRFLPGAVIDADGDPLVLEGVWVSNRDLADAIAALNANNRDPAVVTRFGGWGPAEVASLTWDPRIELAPIPAARRRYDQLTMTLTTEHGTWRGEGSLTFARLHGNVPGVTGHGAVGDRFTAGPFVRPNEGLNSLGILPDATEFEAKAWMTALLPLGARGGLLLTHILGERTTPSFTLEGRYRYTDAAGTVAPEALMRQVLGQVILVEPRGSRHYASRTLLDLHLERTFAQRAATRYVLALDLLNALGSRAITRVKTSIDDLAMEDPTSYLGAPRERVYPRALRLGLRIEPAR